MALQTSAKHEMLRASDSGDPVDILEASAASQARRRPPAERRPADAADFARNSEGRMIIRDEDTARGKAFPCIATGHPTVQPQHLLQAADRLCARTGMGCFFFCDSDIECSTQVQSPSGGQVAALMTEQAMTAILMTCARLGVSGAACRAQAPNRCAHTPL